MAYKSKYTGSQIEDLLDKAGTAIQNLKTIDGFSLIGSGNISITSHNRGYYQTEEILNQKQPTGNDGDIAYVGSSYPFSIYNWDGSSWIDSGATGGQDNVDLSNYTTPDEVSNIFSSMFVSIGSEEELREMLEYGDYDKNKIYYVVEE